MLGRARAPPSSIDCLELERLPSKQIKDDALSIYEITLQKLRLGSRCALRPPITEAKRVDAPCSSASASPSSSTGQSVVSLTKEMEEDS